MEIREVLNHEHGEMPKARSSGAPFAKNHMGPRKVTIFPTHTQWLDSREKSSASLLGSASKQLTGQYGWVKGQDTNHGKG